MKKIYLWFTIIIYILIPIYLVGIAIYSAFTATPIESIINWSWWIFFMVTEMWIDKITSKRFETAIDQLRDDK